MQSAVMICSLPLELQVVWACSIRPDKWIHRHLQWVERTSKTVLPLRFTIKQRHALISLHCTETDPVGRQLSHQKVVARNNVVDGPQMLAERQEKVLPVDRLNHKL